MSLYTYKVFETVADCGSFANAAEVLHLTPSAISHAIANLEEEFEFPLFYRSRRGVRLTDEGKRMLPLIRAARKSNDNIVQEAALINKYDVGVVRIGVFHSVAITWMPEIIRSFKDKYPKIEVRLCQGNYSGISEMLQDNEIDFGIIADGNLKEGQEFIFLEEDPMVCILHEHHETKYKDHITVSEIKKEKLLMQRDAIDIELKEFLEANKIQVHEYMKIDDDSVMVALAEQGIGISIVPRLAVQGTNSNVKILALKPEVHRNLGMITVHSNTLSPATKKMMEEVKNYIGASNT